MQISIGCVRARFARHIAVLILVDACASALGFYLFGFAFAFGDGQDDSGNLYGNSFIGFRFFAMHDMDQAQYFATAVRPYAFWVFEWAVSLPAAPAIQVHFPYIKMPSHPHDCCVALITCFPEAASVPKKYCVPLLPAICPLEWNTDCSLAAFPVLMWKDDSTTACKESGYVSGLRQGHACAVCRHGMHHCVWRHRRARTRRGVRAVLLLHGRLGVPRRCAFHLVWRRLGLHVQVLLPLLHP